MSAALLPALVLAACAATGPTAMPSGYGAVTPPPSPGAFACPIRILAGSPPATRLVDVTVTAEDGFDRVAFDFEPGPPDRPATDAGLLVEAAGVIPRKTATGSPLAVDGQHFIEVRFRDMTLTGAEGASAFRGSRDVKSDGSVREVVEIEESKLALDWLIGTTNGCARAWQDGTERLLVDVQH